MMQDVGYSQGEVFLFFLFFTMLWGFLTQKPPAECSLESTFYVNHDFFDTPDHLLMDSAPNIGPLYISLGS